MAYNVTEDYRITLYSGESDYDCKLYFNDQRIPVEQISTIKISSPIIDTTQETGGIFHIGTFISQAITIKFKNLDGLDLTSNPKIYLEIGLKVNGKYEYVPIGKYIIDDLDENYQQTCEITCLDYAVKFKPNIDISQFFNEEGNIEAGALFEAICRYYGVEAGTYPDVNTHKLIASYDNKISGKSYISMLAENFGGNAKMGRDGKCYVVPLKPTSNIEIDVLSSKDFKVGDTYEISRVCYDTGETKYQAGGNVITVNELPEFTEDLDINSYYYLTTDMKYYKYNLETSSWDITQEMKNTLYIRTSNMFVNTQEQIDNIYNSVKGFKVQNITCENRGDLSLDAWDMIKYTDGENEYYTLNDNEITFNGTSMGKVITNIPTGTKAETTNVILSTEDDKIRKIQTEINEIDNTIKTIIQETQQISTENSQGLKELEEKLGMVQGSLEDYAQESELITIKEELEKTTSATEEVINITKEIQVNGVSKVTTTTGYTFDDEGLTIEKTGAETKSTLNEVGLEVKDTTGSTEESLLFAGYDKETGETIVKSKNMTVEKYLVVGKYSRMEDFEPSGVKATGMFWIGG